MHPLRSTAGVLAVAALLMPVTAAHADDPAPPDDLTGKIESIVAKANPKLMEVLVTRRDDRGKLTFETMRTPTLAQARSVVGGLLGRPGVVAVEMNQPRSVDVINDPLYRYQWGLNSSHYNVTQLRRMTARDTRHPLVAVVDTGVWRNHPDLKGRVTTGYNVFTGATGNTYDGIGHGTHVAGVIAAKTNNKAGIVGLSRTAIIVPVKVFDSSGNGSAASVARGINWAAYHSNVINLSLGGYYFTDAEYFAVQTARANGRVVVASSGNDGTDDPHYPSAYPGVLGVGAHNSAFGVASFSNGGPNVDLTAPGTSIMSTIVPWNVYCGYRYYCKLQGTSMATPHISALAAMAMAHCGYKANTVIDRIQRWAFYWPNRDVTDGFGPVVANGFLSCKTWPTSTSTAAAAKPALPVSR